MDKAIKTNTTLYERIRSCIISHFKKEEENKLADEKKKLLSEIEAALDDLRYARTCFQDAREPEMIEACIYEIKSAEARYSFLLRKAKLMAELDLKISV